MTPDPNAKPEVVAWRLATLETKVDALHTKLDAMRDADVKPTCPAPGLCLTVRETTERLQATTDRHEAQISAFREEFAAAKAAMRTLLGLAVVAQAMISFALQIVLR